MNDPANKKPAEGQGGMNLTGFSLRRPITTVMIFATCLLIGAIGGRLLPLAFFPEMDFPGLLIEIPYPGSTPEEVERLITRPVEEVLATISNIKQMYSDSNEDGAEIFLEFQWGQRILTKRLEAKEKLDGIRHLLPDDMDRYYVHSFSTADMPIIQYRISSNRDLSNAYDMLNRNLKRRVERLDGVSKVDLYGLEKQEIRIEVLLDRVMAHNVDLPRLVENLQRASFTVTAGRITDNNRRYVVRPIGELHNLDEIGAINIGDGSLHLRDIAEIRYGNPELDYGRHLDRKYAIGLDVFKTTGSNTVEVAERVIAEVDEIAKLPEMDGIRVIFLDNQAAGIVASINELLKAGTLGAFFAILVLYFFLRRFATTLIVALAVPSSLLITLGVIYFMGLSLNILSMLGLMLAVGMLVDNAVVITESIHRRQQVEGYTTQTTINGVKEVALAVVAGTFTTAIVFLPNIISDDNQISIQMKHVAITIIVALAASLVIAQTIVPLLATRIKPRGSAEKRTAVTALQEKYSRMLRWTLVHHRISIGIVFLVIASTAIPIKFVKTDLFQEPESKRLRVRYYVNGQYSLEKVEAAVDRVEEFLFANRDRFRIKSVYSFYTTNYANSMIYLKDGKLTRPIDDIKEEIQEGMPLLAIAEPTLERRRSTGDNAVDVQLIGKSSELLAELSRDVAKVLRLTKGLENVRSDAESGDQEVQVVINRDRARHLGLSTQQVAQTIATAMRGMRLPRIRDEEGEIDLKIYFQPENERTMEELRNLPLFLEDGQPIKLASIADFRTVNGPRRIHRENRITSISVSANLGDITMDEARDKIKETLDLYQFPPGYTWNFGQAFDYEDETGMDMMVNTLMALAMIYFVMAALFESLVFPAAIWSSILFAIIGVWWFFLMTGTTFSLMAWIGILILMGVVVNNGIVLIDHVNQLRNAGLPRQEAIVRAGHERLRAILMTAATTVLGLVPLSITNTQIGGDGPPYYPMARAIVGGLTFSTVVTLLILPTIYVMLDDMRMWTRRVIRLGRKSI
ncbi:MAG: efflux RND transporter permease subunit [Candidatus Neomarinimicrobiota bacterium]